MAKKVVSSFLEVKGLVEKDVRSGMNAARDEVEEKLEDNVLGYYDIGNPVMYQRTGTLLESPNTTPVSGGGNHFEFKAEMEENISYPIGLFSGADVIEATEKEHLEHWEITDILKRQERLCLKSWIGICRSI